MQPLRYSINITIDGCADHQAMSTDEELHRHAEDLISDADGLLFGRITYGLMEAWRPIAAGERPDWADDWMVPFAYTIDAAKKYVVSSTLTEVDWNAELVRADELEAKVRQLKAQPGRGLLTGGVTLPLALAGLGLIDEYEFVVHPRLAGRGPHVFDGLSRHVDLQFVGRREFTGGAVALRYVARR